MPKTGKTDVEPTGAYGLLIPLDASGVQDLDPSMPLKVVVQQADGSLQEQTAKLTKDGKGSVAFKFKGAPGKLHVLVGPADATAQELQGLQTLTFDVSSRQWGQQRELQLRPVVISPYYWHWWWRWCYTFTITGRVVCPDGSPVPGAKVCAYDVDWWFFWTSTQQVGCATTDIDGNFEIRFRWCCGWWPWWWWRYRVWQFEPILAERVEAALGPHPEVKLSSRITNQPSLEVFSDLLGGALTTRKFEPNVVGNLDHLRSGLLSKLPTAPELERLHIWPWWPWLPWWDCNPDIIFKVTQDCFQPDQVIVNETVLDTRWNSTTPMNVTLVAHDACCRPICPEPPCEEGECVIIDGVCGIPMTEIGGNLSAPATPEGYALPGNVIAGTAAYNGDRPFAETIWITKNPGDMLNVDYYELEVSTDGGTTWNPLPAGAPLGFSRMYWDTASLTTGFAGFPVTTKSGHDVYESREHYEAASGLTWDIPGADRYWLSYNWAVLAYLDTDKFADGTYRFHMVGWQVDGGGNLINPRTLPICGTDQGNFLILTFDNRVITPVGHPPSHNCGGLVHVCTLEPDTHFLAVRVNGDPVGICSTVADTEGTLEVDFMAHDPDGHLAVYSLIATYGLNQAVDLLAQPGATITPLVPGTPYGPTYGQALGQGATAPHWYGGNFRLSIPLSEAFPEPCCYQLELRAYKRNIVSCEDEFDYANLSEFTIGVGV
jgi:hypothetical protein